MKLPDGTIIPSFLGTSSTPFYDEGSHFGNFGLTKGEVVKIIYPDDTDSYSKKFIEYNVYVENNENSTNTSELIQNVPVWNPLSSGIDYENQVLRAASTPPWSKNNPISDGSKVLVMYIHGENTKPVILGGFRNIDDKYDPGDLNKEQGLYWLRVFNGISNLINDNGEFLVTFNGPTKIDGSLNTDKVSKDAVGSQFLMNKDGGFELSTKNSNQFFQIDHKNKKINSQADSEYNIKVSNGKIKANSTGTELNSATDFFLMGSTYRNAEQQMHTKILSALQTLQTSLTTLSAQLLAAGTAASANPLTANLSAPFAAAGGAMIPATTSVANIIAAINAFEAQAKQYLSTKHKLGE